MVLTCQIIYEGMLTISFRAVKQKTCDKLRWRCSTTALPADLNHYFVPITDRTEVIIPETKLNISCYFFTRNFFLVIQREISQYMTNLCIFAIQYCIELVLFGFITGARYQIYRCHISRKFRKLPRVNYQICMVSSQTKHRCFKLNCGVIIFYPLLG